ncbi:ATP-binding protein [Pseudonocardia kujensis]|uniref:ATP-binding protein n=1 Tax=Pseudonocardia kujensis TaxID=1128675 RepID=UPI001E285EF8|nr:ATP-binding protein [Pseudonocardia kujensis]MCE0762271.1 ATP-binding protein [Pseudonocardia kujensis]
MNAYGPQRGVPAAPTAHPTAGHAAAGRRPGRAVPDELRIVRTAVADELSGIRSAVSRWGRCAGLSADVLVDLLLAVGEAAANAVDHAYRGGPPGPVEVDVQLRRRRSGSVIAARISDQGRWRPTSAGVARDRGRGLPMIRALAARLDVMATGRGTEVCLELAIPD